MPVPASVYFNPIRPARPGLFGGAWAGGGRKVPAAHSSKAIHGIEVKFGRIVENQKLINLVQLNWKKTSLLRHNDVIIVQILDFYQILPIKIKKV